MDETGFSLWKKRLEKDKLPKKHSSSTVVINHEQWGLLLRGFNLSDFKSHSRLFFSIIAAMKNTVALQQENDLLREQLAVKKEKLILEIEKNNQRDAHIASLQEQINFSYKNATTPPEKKIELSIRAI